MRVTKKDLMDKLNVGYELGAYETHPWSCYESESGTTCSAEVRMDPDGTELEAEIQMMYDTPPEGLLPMQQIFLIKGKPNSDGMWEIFLLRLKGEPLEEDIYNWEEKSCNFFNAVTQELQADKIPDIDELIDVHFHSRERLGDQRQGGGGKSPKIKTNQLLGMKKGTGF